MLPFDITAAGNASRIHLENQEDLNFEIVLDWLSSQEELEVRFGRTLRQSIDEVLDGQRTGRFNIDDLEKTEKTYLGTKVEIVARAEFNLGRGRRMDYSIADQDVDSKFTMGDNWTIPAEAVGHICLLVKAHDHDSKFQVGLLRIRDELLNRGRNRDGKRTISTLGRSTTKWIIPNGRLPENILMNLSAADRNAIFQAPGGNRGRGNGGQSRTNELFRRVQEKLVDRNTVLTVASQDDSPKRVRDSRLHLRQEGIIILGHQNAHPHIARALNLPVPIKGSWVAARIARLNSPSDTRPTCTIDGGEYALWTEGDSHSPAPEKY